MLFLSQMIMTGKLLDYTTDDSVEYEKIRAGLEKIGKVIGPLDMLIGAQAKSNELILVTNNLKEFNRIKGLKLENWA